jgi:hypothetical protein
VEVCPILTLQLLKLVGVEIARSPGGWANKIPLGEQFMFFNCVTGLEGCANKIGVEKPIFEPCF